MADLFICSIAGCGKVVNARGYCKSHYKKLIKYGDPLVTKKVARERCGPNHCGKARCQAAITLSNHIRYVKNPEPIKKKSKDWKVANPERERQSTNKRRADGAASHKNLAWPTTGCHSRPARFCHWSGRLAARSATNFQPAPRRLTPPSDCKV